MANPSIKLISTGSINEGLQKITAINTQGEITTLTLITGKFIYIYTFNAAGQPCFGTRHNLASGGKIKGDMSKIASPLKVISDYKSR